MSDPDIRNLTRSATRRRRAPNQATCAACGTSIHLRQLRDGRVLCYQDLRRELGAGAVEEDHIAGRQNLSGITVALLANDHRTITEIRMRLGTDSWRPATGDPLTQLAHLLAGIASLLVLLGEWLLDHVDDGRGSGLGVRPFPVVA